MVSTGIRRQARRHQGEKQQARRPLQLLPELIGSNGGRDKLVDQFTVGL